MGCSTGTNDVDMTGLGSKLRRHREHLQASTLEVAAATGLAEGRLHALEAGERLPTADEARRLSTHYGCRPGALTAPGRCERLERTEALFSRHADVWSPNDRRAVVELLFLCDGEELLWRALGRAPASAFTFTPSAVARDRDGAAAASALRAHFGYEPAAIVPDVYSDLRRLGIHVFRRRLENPAISGLYINHPTAGACVLVNFVDDVYSQRFAAARGAAHAILDGHRDFFLSFASDSKDPLEHRADVFAACYLLPRERLEAIPEPLLWDRDKARAWARKLLVNVEALAYALRVAQLIGPATESELRGAPLQEAPPEESGSRLRVRTLLRRGLSQPYVHLCFEALERGLTTRERLAEMLLVSPDQVEEVARMYQCEPREEAGQVS